METKSRTKGKGKQKTNGTRPVGSTANTEASVPRRFQEACEAIEARNKIVVSAVKSSLDLSDQDSSDGSQDEKEDISHNILQKVLKGYQGSGLDHPERTQQFLVDSLTSGALVCLICIETVKRGQPVWSCHGCFGIFHLPCIQKWATDSIQIQNAAAQEQPFHQQDNNVKKAILWCCPKCRHEYEDKDKPVTYYCFCGKQRDPVHDPWLVPHSCGSICQKNLRPLCSHKCLLLCHPGPCPPCAQMVRSSCYCGSQGAVPRRCSRKEWSCQQPCKKMLECSQHTCKDPCHPGECAPCPRQSVQECCCGRDKQLRKCASPHWQCDQPCGRPLSCGHHSCSRICHKGPCGPCPKEGTRKCPCGKTEVTLPCTEDVATCGDTCDKTLECGLHLCAQRCHLGPCGNCLQVIVKRCRCGAKEKALPCFKEYLCESKCKNSRACLRHPCSRKCCDGNCPPCEQICGRGLRCKNHKCNSQCHRGPCYPCPLTLSVFCNCKGTKVTVPCGREKTTKPPRCKLPCKVPPDCHHPERESHHCHQGLCPPCRQICSMSLVGCKHSCPAPCHDAVRVKVKIQQKRAGPWEPVLADREEVVKQNCPACMVPMPLQCLGQHTVSAFPCSEIRPWSCGRACGRPLQCGNHTCTRECHLPNEECGPCDSNCGFPRPDGCKHPCSTLVCHGAPCPPCPRMEPVSCHCGLSTLHLLCSEWTSAGQEQRNSLMCCLNRCPRQLSCGHRCPQLCHPGACPPPSVCKKRVPLRCPCKRIKQEHPCNSKASSPNCDQQCLEIQKQEETNRREMELKKKEEEERQQQQELEKFIRKTEGKRKRSRKPRLEQEEDPFWTKGKITIATSGLVTLLACLTYYFFIKAA